MATLWHTGPRWGPCVNTIGFHPPHLTLLAVTVGSHISVKHQAEFHPGALYIVTL